MPKESQPNVKLTGIKHPESGIVFDSRGFPILDQYVKYETRITGDLKSMTPDMHKRMATRQLRADIEAGIVDENMFTEKQLNQIKSGLESVEGFVWHHHQDIGRMQLLLRRIHEATGHVGGDKLWGIQK